MDIWTKDVARRIARYRRKGHGPVVVVTALGDTTNALMELAYKIAQVPGEKEHDMLISTGEQV